jgi:hypothetical protein
VACLGHVKKEIRVLIPDGGEINTCTLESPEDWLFMLGELKIQPQSWGIGQPVVTTNTWNPRRLCWDVWVASSSIFKDQLPTWT